MTAKRSGLNEPADNLIRAAADAYSDSDDEFLTACEARWAKAFAPDGPTLRELIQIAVSRAPSDGGPPQKDTEKRHTRRR